MARYTCLGQRNPACTARYHGTPAAYNRARCRCPHAKEANRLYHKRRREQRQPAGHIDATGARRRLQALNAIGWPFDNLAPRLHTEPSHLRSIARGDTTAQTLYRNTVDRITALYRELSAVPGPSAISRTRAAAKGWLSPAYWDNIDDPTEQPTPLLVTAGETLEQRRARHADRYRRFLDLLAAGQGRTGIRRALNINNTIYNQLLARAAADQTGEVAA